MDREAWKVFGSISCSQHRAGVRDVLTVTQESWIKLGDAILQPLHNPGIGLGVSEQVGVAGERCGLWIVRLRPTGKQIAHLHAAIRRSWVVAVVVHASGEQKLLDDHVEAALLW